MGLQPQELTALVGLAGIASTVLMGTLSLSEARKRSHIDRLWARSANAYEAFIAYLFLQQKRRHEQMTEPDGALLDPDPADADADVPALNQLDLYGSELVREVARRADAADRDWRRAYVLWQEAAKAGKGMEDTEQKVLERWRIADAWTELVRVLIKKELRSGRPVRRGWLKRQRYDGSDHLSYRATSVLLDEEPRGLKRLFQR